MGATNGFGVDVAFDATGVPAAVDSALLSVRPHGTFVVVAICEEKPHVEMNVVVLRKITVTGSAVYRDDHPELLAAIAAGKLQALEDLVTRKIVIEDVVEKGLKALTNEKYEQIPLLFEFTVKIFVHPRLTDLGNLKPNFKIYARCRNGVVTLFKVTEVRR